MIIIKNTESEDLFISLPAIEGELRTEVTIAPNDSYEVPGTQEEEILNWYLSAVLKVDASTETDGEVKTDDTVEDSTTDTTVTEETKLSEAEIKIAEERTAILAERQTLENDKAEAKFTALLTEGKLTPAQKESFMALYAKGVAEISLAEGKTKKVSELLAEFIESAPKVTYLKEEAGTTENEEKEEIELDDEEKKVAEMFGNSEESLKAIKKEEK